MLLILYVLSYTYIRYLPGTVLRTYEYRLPAFIFSRTGTSTVHPRAVCVFYTYVRTVPTAQFFWVGRFTYFCTFWFLCGSCVLGYSLLWVYGVQIPQIPLLWFCTHTNHVLFAVLVHVPYNVQSTFVCCKNFTATAIALLQRSESEKKSAAMTFFALRVLM